MVLVPADAVLLVVDLKLSDLKFRKILSSFKGWSAKRVQETDD